MQAVTLAAAAAGLVAVPLILYLGLSKKIARRRERRVSERRRSEETAIRLSGGERKAGASRSGRSRGRRPKAHEPSIDLFQRRSAEAAGSTGGAVAPEGAEQPEGQQDRG